MLEEYKIRIKKRFFNKLNNTLIYICENLKRPNAAESLRKNVFDAINNRKKMAKAFKPYMIDKNDGLNLYYIKVQNFYIFYVIKEEENIMEVRDFIYARSDVSRHINN